MRTVRTTIMLMAGGVALAAACLSVAAANAQAPRAARDVPERQPAPAGQVEVDFARHAYFPLLQERMGLFQENEVLQSKDQFLANLAAIRELPSSTFRLLGSFGDDTPFNSPAQVYGQIGAISVRASPALERAVEMIRAAGKLPVVSWYGTPPMLRGPQGARGMPTDLSAYADAMARLARLYGRGGPLVWEVLNEPNLDQFLRTNDNIGDYAKVFAATAGVVKAAGPDILIAGPSLSDEAEPTDFQRFTTSLAEPVNGTPPPIDYFSFHIYRNHSAAQDRFAIARNAVGDRFDTVPFLITEYENFHPVDTFETKQLRETATGAVFFFNHARMLAEQTDVASVTWNRFMTNAPRAARANPGGLLSFEGAKRAIYNAFLLYDWLPADRSFVQVANARGVQAMASADPHNAGVLLWNASPGDQIAEVKVGNLPAAIAARGRLRVYRIDARHASGVDGAPAELVAEDERAITGASTSLPVKVPSSSVVYLRFDDGSGRSLDHRRGPAGARFVRSWSYVPRVRRDGVFVSEGNYGSFDPGAWILRTGVRTTHGQGIAGVTLNAAPRRLPVRFTISDAKPDGGADDLAALRVDYWNGTRWSRSVLHHDGKVNAARTTLLPWGKGGANGDRLIDRGTVIGDGKTFGIDVDRDAPADWDRRQRRILVTAWTVGTGAGSQSIVSLGAEGK